MFPSVVLLAVLNIAVAFPLTGDVTAKSTRTRRDAHYRGPPAPLNHDGTVAFTPEFHEANAVHNAAYLEEYKRLHDTESLAAAHPDLTSPPDHKSHQSGQYNPQHEDDGEYRPNPYETEQSNDHYSSGPYSPLQHNQNAQVPHTPEYHAIAASLEAARSKSIVRHRRSINHYQGPPAPLNHDGTVANTPEIQHAIAVHYAAYDLQHQKLQEAKQLADAHPDLSSHEQYDHQQYQTGQYDSQQDDGHYLPSEYDNDLIQHDGQYLLEKSYQGDSGDYNMEHADEGNQYDVIQYTQEPSHSYNPEAHIPAPLNHDGTVAHTAEYKAVAAAHQAEYSKAAQRAKSVTSFRSHPIHGYSHH